MGTRANEPIQLARERRQIRDLALDRSTMLRGDHVHRCARPVALVGKSFVTTEARTQLHEFAARTGVPLLSDWEGEATRACDAEIEIDGMRVSARCAFLLADGTVRAACLLGSEMPDIDAVIAAASSSSL